MKNLLKLHEAIALALLNKESRTCTYDEIANFIEKRGLFSVRKGNITLSKQVMLRSTKSNQRYSHWFEALDNSSIRFRNLIEL
ncbi:hypothetical protein JN11_01180 [Mucilaginibacter frigoritolerans]|uniref:HB1/ASXL restriction endonuclease-like protein with HTH domain n=1 Tax=Mucilaginibacter frigoritolerans TaxID=652788 RepID=A0A562U9L2_9SPHI|nr:hypothetical protein [Mucilaginibacter frigoritolerans]TWJ02209.1 hypothetical protein JN11_01180 [Mucilaginibacter frigoritolerans]